MHLRLLAILTVLGCFSPAQADPGEPVAVRLWQNNVISIETQWDLTVVVNLASQPALPNDLADADLVVFAGSAERRHFTLSWRPSESPSVPRKIFDVQLEHLDHYLDRLPNSAELSLVASTEASFVSKNAVCVSQVGEDFLMVSVDGVRIAVPLRASFSPSAALPKFDALVIAELGGLPAEQQAKLVRQATEIEPRYVLFHAPLDGFDLDVKTAVGNSMALSFRETETPATDSNSQDSGNDASTPTAWVRLATEPWVPPAELARLWERKEIACAASQSTFSKLSVSQMNFKPANGTHTPRWNAEHMMGRELGFFSEIYAQLSTEISKQDFNPKQMPNEYVARNPDWDGREEARQMQRVSSFTRRFAYLLDGLDLEQKAPGSSWTLRKLLVQMEAHYQEHTANVIKKFELPEWPKE